MSTSSTKMNKGFAAMPKDKVSEIARLGGNALSMNRAHMAEIGRKGGEASGQSRRKKTAHIKIDDDGGCGCAMIIIAIGFLIVCIRIAEHLQNLNQ